MQNYFLAYETTLYKTNNLYTLTTIHLTLNTNHLTLIT